MGNFNIGYSPTSYTITGLVEGVPYHVRSYLSNSLGQGPLSISVSNTPKDVPDAPRFVAGSNAAHVNEVQTIQSAATHVDEVQVMTVTADHVSEVQSVRTTATQGSTLSGTFYLSFTDAKNKTVTTATEKQTVTVNSDGAALLSGGYKLKYNSLVTGCIKFDAPATTMESELEALAGIDAVQVVRTGDDLLGYTYTVAFMDSNTVNHPEMTVVDGPSAGHNSCRGLWYGGENFTVSVEETSEGGLGGVFSHDVTAATMQTEINKIPGIKAAAVTRSLVDLQGGYYWTISFDGNNGNLIESTRTSSLSGIGQACDVSTLVDGNYISGTYILNLGDEST